MGIPHPDTPSQRIRMAGDVERGQCFSEASVHGLRPVPVPAALRPLCRSHPRLASQTRCSAASQPLVAVGTPVARRSPHRSRRAVVPHRAPRCDSLPPSQLSGSRLLLSGRVACGTRPGLSGPRCLGALRPTVPPFPLWTALPSSEDAAVLRRPMDHRPAARVASLRPGSHAVSHVPAAVLPAHPRSTVDPGRPSGSAPTRCRGVGFWGVQALAIGIRALTGLSQASGRAVPLTVYVVPCVRCTCCVRLCTSSAVATLGRSGG